MTIVVNGVPFAPTTSLLNEDPRNATGLDFSNGTDAGDPEYDALCSSLEFGGGTDKVTIVVGDGDGDGSVTGGGLLLPGSDYEVQVWYVDDRAASSTRSTPVGDGNLNQATLKDQFVIGTFTADGTTQELTLESPGFGQAHLTAYQIRLLTKRFATGVLDLSGRDTTGLGSGESNGFFTAPKTFGATTDFSLNDIAYSSDGVSGTFDVEFSAASSLGGISRGGRGAWGTASSAGGSALVNSGQSITISNLSITDLQGDLVGLPLDNVEVIAVYLGNQNSGDGATLNGELASGAAGGVTEEAMRNDITPAGSVVIAGTGGDGFSINGIAIRFEVGIPSAPSPTLSMVATSPVSGPFVVDAVFTEDVTGLEETDFVVVNGAVTASSLSGSGDTYSVEITPTANGDVEITLPAGTVIDTEGNGNVASNPVSVLHVQPGSDQPGVVISTAASPVFTDYTVDLAFTEDVTGLELSDFEVTNGGVSELAGSGASYSVVVTPGVEGDVTVVLPEESVTDVDGDMLPNAESNVLIADFQTPTVPLPFIFGSKTSSASEFSVYLSFSEEVTGLTDDDFLVVNGSISGTTGSGRYWSGSVTAAAAGPVEISLPAGVVTDADGDGDTNLASNTHVVSCTSDFGSRWVIDDQGSWTAATGSISDLTITNGLVTPDANSTSATFSSATQTYSEKRKATEILFRQSSAWVNWTKQNINPGGSDAPVFVPVGNDNYYYLARSGSVYHAWHSTDMVTWTDKGPVTSGAEGRWVTSAEYKDGSLYVYSDFANDHASHLFIDSDLEDGLPGTYMGKVFDRTDPSTGTGSGSDLSVIRDDADGLFHLIYEDWSPINASTHSWDSPLAGHVSSADGAYGFREGEHDWAVDNRMGPTGTFATYSHPFVSYSPVYEVHDSDQDAYGDWTSVKVGSRYYMFGDFDPHGEAIKLAIFSGDSLYEEFDLVGSLDSGGHPDPTVGFAEGQFYLITQKDDFYSPGPWVEGVEARAGVDTDGDSVVDEWTLWQDVSEQYDHTPGYLRVVSMTPALVDLSALSAGYGFAFEFRVDDTEIAGFSPIMDEVEMAFERSNFQDWADDEGSPSDPVGDHNSNGIPNLVEFALGQDFLPEHQADGSLEITVKAAALEDGYTLDLEFSDTLAEGSWTSATLETMGVKLVGSAPQPNGDVTLTYDVMAPPEPRVFWRIVVD